jgi:hypothetical protein
LEPRAADEEKLMPETQSLLPRRFSSRAMRGWGAAVIVTLAFLGALPAGDNAFVRAKSNVTQLMRQTTWESALANEPASSPWPWEDIVMPAEGASVPRLGLSAAVLRASGDDTEPSRPAVPVKLPKTSAMQDPHLMPIDIMGQHTAVTSSESIDPSDTNEDFANEFGCKQPMCSPLGSAVSAAPSAVNAEPVVAPQSSAEKQL